MLAPAGTVLGVRTDDRAIPPAAREDSLTMTSFSRDKNWWGPTSAVRDENVKPPAVTTETGTTDGVSPEPDTAAPVIAVPAAASDTPTDGQKAPRPPIDVDTD